MNILKAKKRLARMLGYSYEQLQPNSSGYSFKKITADDLLAFINRGSLFVINYGKWFNFYNEYKLGNETTGITGATAEEVAAGYVTFPKEADSPDGKYLRVNGERYKQLTHENYLTQVENGSQAGIYSFSENKFFINQLKVGDNVSIFARSQFIDRTEDTEYLPFTDLDNSDKVIDLNEYILTAAKAFALEDDTLGRLEEGSFIKSELEKKLDKKLTENSQVTKSGTQGNPIFNLNSLPNNF